MALDLNLLHALDALLQERSVTKAAVRLQLSQPSLSESLRRLRVHYGDELLSRQSNRYVLTPLAERLAAQLPDLLSTVNRLLDVRPTFDPRETTREFTLMASDAHQAVFGRELADIFAREAPRSGLRLQHSTEAFISKAETSLLTVDALALPQELLSTMPHFDLYSDEWVCIVAEDGPFSDRLGLDEMQRTPWVLPYMRSSTASSLLERLRSAGVDPRRSIVVETFASMPALIRDSDRMGMIPKRALERIAGAGVRSAASPIEFGTVVESLWWHPTHDRDPGHAWFRSAVARAAQQATQGIPVHADQGVR